MVCGRRTVHGQQKEEALRTGRQLLIGARGVPELEQPPENTICQNPSRATESDSKFSSSFQG
jgi:hypothetical protein